MVKIELMRIEPGTLFTGSSRQTLFKRMSSQSLFPRSGLPSLPSPTPTLQPNLPTNSVVCPGFTGLRSPYLGYRMLGRRTLSGGGRVDRSPRMERKPEEEVPATRVSLPCVHGCCYCVYGRLLGPVRVHVSNFIPEKKERKIKGITDGNGKCVLPVSRKPDIKGLVYDHATFSLHPPRATPRPAPRPKPVKLRRWTGSTSVSSGYQRVWSSQPRVQHKLR